jgi:chromosome segregation ATPase
MQTFLGRQKPSGSKLHYLSHLDDCRRISALGIDEALSNLSQIETAIKDNPMVNQRLLEKSETIKAGLLYLSAELANLKGRIEELRKMVCCLPLFLNSC